ncbi:hypothetical protein PYK79_53930 [Streptomyces sp. ID05-04B]|uniref:hypothetical protein n=1 Tax=unclassified Streptomyces TaxID=2593676 RepID=UPI000D19BCC5|nr:MULTISPECIES: hypothetical protein [unclassified Streptomyces]AVV46529.1 hypothetical protein C6376_39365 [Streptomyces sp. P3]MDX5570414.1 hypothetical protein [Streptomyces sp. ID05-04B]
MAVTTEELVPVLEDARQAHAALLDRFGADAMITPPGPHRQTLERRAAEVHISLERIHRLQRSLRPRGLLESALGATLFVSRGAVRTALLPLTIGSVVVRGLLPGGGPADPRHLLRNTEDEYAAVARALATCRAGEVLAEQMDDQPTADLLGSLRRQDEELLQELEGLLTDHAHAVAQVVAERGIRQARGTLEDAARGRPEPGPMAEEVLGAVRQEEDLPIPGFGRLSTKEIAGLLPTLSQLELTVVEGYEHAHARRKAVLSAIERLRAPEPWTGYDALDAAGIAESLRDAPTETARQVLEYEQRHRRRQEVVAAAAARASA